MSETVVQQARLCNLSAAPLWAELRCTAASAHLRASSTEACKLCFCLRHLLSLLLLQLAPARLQPRLE